jgi:secondary thiamine-phosphate synthase enzyme
MYHAKSFTVATTGRRTYEITRRIQEAVASSGIERGLCSVFVHHTSASLIVCENADPDVRRDLETFMSRLVVDGDRAFIHMAEGPDDMPAHIRSILTVASVTIPVERGRCDLGTWQGVFLWEHRTHPHQRKVTVSIVG